MKKVLFGAVSTVLFAVYYPEQFNQLRTSILNVSAEAKQAFNEAGAASS